MILGVALLAVITDYTLGGAETLPSVRMTVNALAVAIASLAFSPVYGISPVSSATLLAVRSCRQIIAWLFTMLLVITIRMPVAIAPGAGRKEPVL